MISKLIGYPEHTFHLLMMIEHKKLCFDISAPKYGECRELSAGRDLYGDLPIVKSLFISV